MKPFLLCAVALLCCCSVILSQRSGKKRVPVKNIVPAAPAAATYLRAVQTGSTGNTQDISWIYLTTDGIIVKDPKYGVDPIDIAAEKKHNASKTGRYTITDNKMIINWENGKTAEWTIDRKGNEFSSIDGGTVGKQTPLPANYRIAGQYTAESILPSVSSSTTLVFSKDGTFSQSSFGGVNTASGSAVSQDLSDGTYNISGNTLRLNYANGQKIVSMITIWTLADGKKYLVINGSSFPQK